MITTYLPLYKKNLNLAFPVILSQVGQITVSLVDNMMVGHAGTTELAAASFSNSIFHVGMLFGIGITMGITPLVGKVFSQHKEREAGEYLKNGFFLHILAAFVILVVMTGVSFFLDRMGQPAEVSEKAFSYFLLLVTSLVPLLLFYSFKQFLEGIGNTKLAMVITLTANLVNVVLNYLLIFGKFGFPEMGLNGAGVATLISRAVMPLLLIPVVLKNKRYKHLFSLAYQAKLQLKRIGELLAVGLPIGLQIIVEVLTFSLGAVMMGWLGKEPLAAHQIALGMASFTYMISLGVGAGTTIHVSHEYGAQNYPLLRQTIFASLHLILLFMSLMGIVFILLRFQLPYLFTEDPAVIRVAASLLIIAALFQVFDGTQVALLSALRGLSDVKVPMLMAFVSYSLVGIPVSYVCAFTLNMGSLGIWIGFLFGLAVAAVLFSLRLKKLVGQMHRS
ncbi:MATE family efflux transporter [Gaoshiqia sp. Z1-71]|uniref:MATE family efflux transporter n=1 Tax=Gaoshiqia hydrogeniformans TaxID=3290090 RepID=UPI003BF80B24